MSLLVVQVAKREETRATAIVEFDPGQPVQFRNGDRVLSDVLKLERPLPLATLIRHVLTRYGLEPAAEVDDVSDEEQPQVYTAHERETLQA